MEFSQIASQCYVGDGQTHMEKLTDLHVLPQNAFGQFVYKNM